MTMALIMNLGGIPPIINFIAKIIVLKEIISMKIVRMASTALIVRAINLYIYIRMVNPMLILTHRKIQKNTKENKPLINTTMLMVIISPLIIIVI
jgi:NADH:ubiquinone oxidoreductase subunit 2 (subunit N)